MDGNAVHAIESDSPPLPTRLVLMRYPPSAHLLAIFLSAACACVASGQDAGPLATKDGIEHFEKFIRPVLAERCYSCHSTQAGKSRGGLVLDSRAGIVKGGDNGSVLVPGDIEKSRLIQAIRWTDPDFAMPPKGKLTPQQIERFEQWVKMGAPDPRTGPAAKSTIRAHDLDAARAWWAFRPLIEAKAPSVDKKDWPRSKFDRYVLHELEAKRLSPSPAADPRTLIERAYLDLVGYRPTFEQAQAFVKNSSDDAYASILDQLLASPHYGQRWGRYWLDVARYGDDNPTSEATNPPYPFAWRYRDWVIGALNRDVPYDRFVSLQLAADRMPDVPRSDLVATGFLGIGPVYHKDGRLSKDVIENLYMEDWDERVDAVSRGILGLTVACARCHDHKFDPITSRDYYSLAGVFASTAVAPRPLGEVDPAAETSFMTAVRRLFYLNYAANLLRSEPGSRPQESRKKVESYVAQMDRIEAEVAGLGEKYPALYGYLAGLDKRAKTNLPASTKTKGRGTGGSMEPFFHSVFEAGTWVDGADPDMTMIDVRPGEPRDLRVLPGGNVATPGEVAPRGFPAVLAKGDPAFHDGSGRRELAERIFTDAAPLASRVIVNRVWGWHFGKPLVETSSDFGKQGDRPSHPELLDDLAARFVASGWSLKWLHREIMLSATYRQASRPRPEMVRVDPANRLLWRMNPRRLDIEAYRDCLLQAAGRLDVRLDGPPIDLDQFGNDRRTVYARISRGRTNNLLQLFGFPEATMHSPGRLTTTTPLQQLFVMNNSFLRDQAAFLVENISKEGDRKVQVRALYHKVLVRDPSEREAALADEFLSAGTMTDYAHALLSTNEVLFWP
jgi:Protein of unknown function (DUF1553)/Protein of unknown function (DUF1549)/Planctomycete cytochrome C